MKEALEFPTASLKNEHHSKYRGLIRRTERLGRRAAEIHIGEVESLVRERADCEEISKAACDDLTERYRACGITIERDDFPRVYFIDDGLQKMLGYDRINGGGFDVEAGIVIIFAPPENSNELYEIPATVHHELHHGLGRQTLVYAMDPQKELFRFSGQSGFYTRDPKNWSPRGRVLEEGVVEYFAQKFSLSDDPRVKRYRPDPNSKKRFEPSVEYVLAARLIEKLLSRAANRDADGAQRLENLLFAARIDAETRYRLIDFLREVYPQETVGLLFSTTMTIPQLEVLSDIL